MTNEIIALADDLQSEMLALIDRANLADSTKKKYSKAMFNYVNAGNSLTNPQQLATYASEQSKSTRAFLKAVIKLWSDQMILQIKGQVTPATVQEAQAAIMRFEALQAAISTKNTAGQKAHTWLTKAETKQLIEAVGGGIQGQRDRLALGLLVGAGLRREEAVSLMWVDVKEQPIQNQKRTVLQVFGKGAKDRVVPVSDRLAQLLDDWKRQVGGHGFILRSIDRKEKVGNSLSAVGLFKIVNKYGKKIGKPDLAPHDLRRTYAQIGFESGVAITQVSKLLGHSSVATTQRYLNLDLDLQTTISDFVPL